jgi:hypothetical protein
LKTIKASKPCTRCNTVHNQSFPLYIPHALFTVSRLSPLQSSSYDSIFNSRGIAR